MPTPFCTIIGQMCSTAYEFICTKINYTKYNTNNTNTNLREKDLVKID